MYGDAVCAIESLKDATKQDVYTNGPDFAKKKQCVLDSIYYVVPPPPGPAGGPWGVDPIAIDAATGTLNEKVSGRAYCSTGTKEIRGPWFETPSVGFFD